MNDKLIKDLAAALGADAVADQDLESAAAKAKSRKVASIREVGKVLAGINEYMDDDDVVNLADAVAEKLSNGDPSIKKSRKTEVKLLIEQRENITPMVDGYTELQEEYPEKKLNIRAKVLAGLRELRREDSLSPAEVLEKAKAAMDLPVVLPTVSEKAHTALEALARQRAFHLYKADGSTGLNPDVESLIAKLGAYVTDGPVEPEAKSADVDAVLEARAAAEAKPFAKELDEEMAEIAALENADDINEDLDDIDDLLGHLL